MNGAALEWAFVVWPQITPAPTCVVPLVTCVSVDAPSICSPVALKPVIRKLRNVTAVPRRNRIARVLSPPSFAIRIAAHRDVVDLRVGARQEARC